MIAAIYRWIAFARRVRELQDEIRQMNAALLSSVVERERERTLAIGAAALLVERAGMILPDAADNISAGTPAHEYLRRAAPRLCGVVGDGKPKIH